MPYSYIFNGVFDTPPVDVKPVHRRIIHFVVFGKLEKCEKQNARLGWVIETVILRSLIQYANY